MRLFKPRRLSVMTRPMEEPPDYLLAVTTFLMFDSESPDLPLLDQAMWPFLAEELEGRALDSGVPKPRGEFIVVGDAVAPGDRPVQAMNLLVRVAGREKALRVFGDRFWTIDHESGEPAMTDPAPFQRMPVTYARAFGGEGFARNPLGKGFGAAAALARGEPLPLPNVEDPEKLVLAPEDVREPCGFAALDAAWPQRRAHLGTFDRSWLERQHPGHPLDTDWSFYNEAPRDQWIEGFFTGDEAFEVFGMDAEGRGVVGRLPGLTARCFLLREGAEAHLTELQGRCETLWLFPNHRKGVLAFRAVARCADEEASDIESVLVACERLGDAPRPLDYYAEEYRKRTDETAGAYHLLNDSALMPRIPERLLDERAQRRAALQREQAQTFRDNRQMRMERALAQAGLAGAINFGEAPRVPEVDDLLETMPVLLPEELASGDVDLSELIEWKKKLEEGDHGEILKRLHENPNAIKEDPFSFRLSRDEESPAEPPERPDLPVRALDLEEEKRREGERVLQRPTIPGVEQVESSLEEMLKEVAALPAPSADRSFALDPKVLPDHPAFDKGRMAEALNAQLDRRNDPAALLDKTRTELANASEGYAEIRRMSPYPIVPEDPLHPEVAAHLGQVVVTQIGQGQSLSGHDLAGSDLRGADLSGRDLRNCLLEKCDLSQAKLRGADLEGATLAGAKLDGADFTGANLKKTNLSMVSARRTDFTAVTFEAAMPLLETDFGGACFAEARLSKVQFLKGLLHDVSFERAHLTEVICNQCELSRLKAADCSGERFILVESVLDRADFANARIDRLTLLNCSMQASRFDRADLQRFVMMGGGSLAGSSFRKAVLTSASIREVDLDRADFSGALLEQVDLSGVTAREAAFVCAVLDRVLLGRADLDGSDFLGAKLVECQLKRVSMNRASLAEARLYGVNGEKVSAERLDLRDAVVHLSTLKDEERRALL